MAEIQEAKSTPKPIPEPREAIIAIPAPIIFAEFASIRKSP
jgi:hypothetical protein